MSWRIVIIGAGIGGLATAISIAKKTSHHIRIVERSPELKEVGAGIQITPNASRILKSWGLGDEFDKITTLPNYMDMRTYRTNQTFGLVPANIQDYADRVWGDPHWLVHRIDYQQVLAQTALSLGVTLEFGVKVTHVDIEQLSVRTETGDIITADLIIGADGIHSRTRQCISVLADVKPIRAVNYCYRALLPRKTMLSNPLTIAIISNQNQISWAGHLKHIIGYPIANGSLYNLVLVIADEQSSSPLAAYNQPADVTEMQEHFAGWHEAVMTMLNLAETCTKWTLAELPALPTWRSHNSRVVLLGDAAHAMTPHAASGAAMTIEDAEVLGHCIASCTSLDDLSGAMAAYEDLRKGRCEHVQKIARDNAITFSLADGPEQEERDARMNAATMRLQRELGSGGELMKPVADMAKPFPHPEVVMWLYGYDANAEAKTYLAGRAR